MPALPPGAGPIAMSSSMPRPGVRSTAGGHAGITAPWTVTAWPLGCQAKSPVRTVNRLDVGRQGDYLFIDIEANAFLHHMVRNIAGVLMTIGAGDKPPAWAAEILGYRDRTLGGVTAPPQGLFLMSVTYPDHFLIPDPGIALF